MKDRHSYFLYIFLLMLAGLLPSHCGFQDSSSSTSEIIRADPDPKNRIGRITTEQHPAVGKLILEHEGENTPICNITRVATHWAITANHCYENLLWGRYKAQFSHETFTIIHEPKRLAHLDLVVLLLSKKTHSDFHPSDLEKNIDAVGVSFEPIQPDSKLNLLVHADGALQTAKQPDADYVIEGSLIFHHLNTKAGDSGSPILQDGKFVGVHIGYDKLRHQNIAVALGDVDFKTFTFQSELDQFIQSSSDTQPIQFVKESCDEEDDDDNGRDIDSPSDIPQPPDDGSIGPGPCGGNCQASIVRTEALVKAECSFALRIISFITLGIRFAPGGFVGVDTDQIDTTMSVKAPGIPTTDDGFIPKKNWDGKSTVPAPNGSRGYPAKDGSIWVPTGSNPSIAHGGPHWDVQHPRGGYTNVYPGGKTRPGRK